MKRKFARVALWGFAVLALLAAYSLLQPERSARRRHGQELVFASSLLAAITIFAAQKSRGRGAR